MQMQFRTAEDASCMSDCNLKIVNICKWFVLCMYILNKLNNVCSVM